MPRKKLYASTADRMQAYRNRLREQGKSCDGRKRFERLVDWKINNPGYKKKEKPRRFIGLDTEGVTRNGKHICCLIGDSTGAYLEDYKDGLATHKAFEFLLEAAGKNRILVGYSFGYDVNMILKDCAPSTLLRLSMGMKATQEFENGRTYLIEWFPGKSFYVARLADNKSVEASALTYDVFGFFQKAFVKTAREFNVITPEEDKFLSEMKADRSSFKAKDREKIREYNLLECRVLVRIMDSLRDAMKIADCVPERWNGAGAIAGTLLKRNGIKDKNYTPEKMMPYFLGAYFGGRIQILQMGEHHNVYTHDVISAYPAAMIELPSAVGTWRKTSKFKPGYKWAIYVVEWKLPDDTLIAPFPFRAKINATKTINYPNKGKGVYWFPEVEQALKHYPKHIKIHYGYYFKPEEENVFNWIQELFEARKRFKNSSDPKEKTAQLPIKLGINSLYGKTAQGIGYKGTRPSFQNYFWAGWITSKTRARMFDLAMQDPKNIIAFATDGVFSKNQLAESGKDLGGWEVDQANYLFIIKAGVYAFGKSDDLACRNTTGKAEDCEKLCDHQAKKSRGHFLKDVPFPTLQKLWREQGHFGKYEYKTTKFFGLKVAMQAQDYLSKWRKWMEVPRTINFFPSNQIPDDVENVQPVKRMRCYAVNGSSLPYEPKGDWYEGDEGIAYLDELDQLDSFYDD